MSAQEETFFCRNCQKQIPTINRTIHELRCYPTSHSSPPAAARENERERTAEKPHPDEILPIAEPVSAPYIPPNNPQPAAPSGWTCERCTYFNENLSSHICEVCGHSCLQIIDDSDVEVDHDDIPILPENVMDVEPEFTSFSSHRRPSPPACASSSSQPASSIPPNSWQCQRCTLMNPNRQDECGACGETRPFQQSRREQLIPDEYEYQEPDPGFVYFNPNTQRQEVRRTRRSNVPSSAMFGATLGAGMAFLNGGSMTRGAIEGAGMGLLGGVMMDLLSEEMHQMQHPPPPRPQSRVIIRRGGGYDNPGMGFGMTPFDLLLAELTEQAMTGAQPQRVREETLQQLPTHVYKAPSAPPSSSSSRAGSSMDTDRTTCSICLSPFCSGENLRTLPCLHHFHVQCIDRWLARSTQCPICKHTIQ